MGALTGRRRSGQAWFWHTEHDTLDKVDLGVLRLDTQIYLATILRIANSPVLPFDYRATVDEILAALEAYRARLSARPEPELDLTPLIVRARELRAQLDRLHERLQTVRGPAQEAVANLALLELGRALVPINYTEAGPFDHDPALHAPALAALQGINRLAGLDPDSDDYRFLRTHLMRRRNAVAAALPRAARAAQTALDRVPACGWRRVRRVRPTARG
jgi:hypothetical protein